MSSIARVNEIISSSKKNFDDAVEKHWTGYNGPTHLRKSPEGPLNAAE